MRPLAVTIAVALIVLAVPAAASAAPGGHVWADTVFSVGGAGDETAVAVATDAAGHPVVVGNAVTSAAGDFDIRYRSHFLDGILRWNAVATTWDNPANPGADDTAAGVVVDDARECVYVAGTTQGAGSGNDIVLLKLDNRPGPLSGDLVWAVTYDGPAGRDDEAEAVALDGSGNVYVTGGSLRADGSMDVLTVKFRPNGTVAWAKRHNNSGARFDRGLAIAVRGTAVYVAGVSNRKGHRDDVVLVRYSLSGARQWVRYYDDPLNRDESVSGVAATAGAVYVCGSGRFTSVRPGDAMLVKYRSDGKRLWVRWAGGNAGSHDAWTDVAADGKGRAHVTGFHDRKGTGDDIVTRMYTTGGRLAWQAGFSSTGRRADVGTAVAVDANANTYVCGFRTKSAGDTDVVAIKYGVKGTTLWTTSYPDALAYPGELDAGDDWAADIAVARGLVFVAGSQARDHGGVVDGDFLTLAIQR